MRIGSLCTGYGGIDIAVSQLLGARTVWTSDIDAGASKIIAHRFPDAPNLGDLTRTDWSTVEPVEIITAGWPCQPFSLAGKQKGADDARAIWPEVARAIRALRPRYVILENVSAIASAGTGPELARAAASLAALGYVGSWLCLRAADVGAPHGRSRIFIVASADAECGEQREQAIRGVRPESRGGVEVAPDTDRERNDRPWRAWNGSTEPADGHLQAVDLLPTPTSRDHKGHNQRRDTTCLTGALLPTPRATDGAKGGPNQRGSSGDLMLPSAVHRLLPTPAAMNPNDGESFETWEARRLATKDRVGNGNGFGTPLSIAIQDQFGQYAEAVGRWESIIGRPAPDPTENGRLAPRFVEFMMGLPSGWVTDVPDMSRAQQLKALGNGVVPQQAYAAISHMINSRECAA